MGQLSRVRAVVAWLLKDQAGTLESVEAWAPGRYIVSKSQCISVSEAFETFVLSHVLFQKPCHACQKFAGPSPT